MFEKSTALFVLEFAGRPFPLEQFADGFGQFGEAEVGEITNRFTDEFELGGRKSTAGKRKFLFRHGWTPLSSGFLTLSSKRDNVQQNFDEEKIFCGRDSRRSWMTQVAGIRGKNVTTARWTAQRKECRSGGEKWRIHGMPRLEKPTNEWVEEQFNAAGSCRKQERRSS
jgi:hypothetical protein